MKHHSQARYPAASDVIIKMFTDQDYHTRKLEKLGIGYKVLEHELKGDAFRMKVERSVPVQASGIIKKIMPATTQVVNEERWNRGDKSGSVVVETKGVPLDMRCTAQMSDDGDECVIDYNWEIKARIPLGGGALEKFVIGDMQKREAEEMQAALTLLDEYR